MVPIYISLIVFAIIFGGALLGILLRRLLPEHHLSAESAEIIKASRSVVTGVAALTLGLLVASAKTSFDAKSADLKTMATKVIMLDRTLVKFGPKSDAARDQLRDMIKGAVGRLEQLSEADVKAERRNKSLLLEQLQNSVLELAPSGDKETSLKSSAVSLTQDIIQARWSIYQSLESSLQLPFLGILTFWLASIFLSIGLLSPVNSSALIAQVLAAGSLAGAVFLTLELDRPYGGFIRLSPAPLRSALDQITLPR